MERFNGLLEQYKYPLILSFVGLVLIVGGLATSGLLANKPKSTSAKDFPKESLVEKGTTSALQIKIDISGAVLAPGVYELNKEDRVEDAIKKAGGFAEGVSQKYVAQNINLSQKLSDGQKLYIPFEGENIGGVLGSSSIGAEGKVSINNASQQELESLPSVGEVTASKIIKSRPYTSLEDLITKKALNRTTFNKIKDQIGL